MDIRPFRHAFFSLLFLASSFVLPLPAFAVVHRIMVNDPSSYSRPDITINVGDTVRWINPCNRGPYGGSCGNLHDVTADDLSFQSATARDFTFEMTFNTPGDVRYHCTVHSRPASAGGTRQNGIIRVVGAAAAPEVAVVSVDVEDGSQKAGEAVDVKVMLTNTGDADSGVFRVKIRISTDTNITSTDREIATLLISNLLAGGSQERNPSVTLPADLAVGDYFIGAIIDIVDDNLSNNTNFDAESIFVFLEFILNAGLNDAWFQKITTGQGFFITIFPDKALLSIAWFTWDTELPAAATTGRASEGAGPLANVGDDGHRWLTGAGDIIGNKAVMPIRVASGGLFDTPTDITRVDDGTFEVEFNKCNEGKVTYDMPSKDLHGVIPIRRVADDNVVLCEALLRELSLLP